MSHEEQGIEIETNEGIILGIPSESKKTVKVVTPDGENYQLDRARLLRGETLERENGDRYFQIVDAPEPEEQVCVELSEGQVCIPVRDGPDAAENIKKLADKVTSTEVRDEVKQKMKGGAAGHANMNVSGNSKLVREIKKHGRKMDDKKFRLGDVEISYSDYKGGYDVRLRYDSRDATEMQVPTFKKALLELFNKGVAKLDLIPEPTYVSTRLD